MNSMTRMDIYGKWLQCKIVKNHAHLFGGAQNFSNVRESIGETNAEHLLIVHWKGGMST